MANQHPTPPLELVQQWLAEPEYGFPGRVTLHTISEPKLTQVLTRTAQWASDQELDLCCEWLRAEGLFETRIGHLRAARRPKPPSLKEQALAALERYEAEEWCEEMTFDSEIIRRALEQLND